MSHPAYNPSPPPAFCTKAKVVKEWGVFAGHYGTCTDWGRNRSTTRITLRLFTLQTWDSNALALVN